jgi:pre-mRNA-processing factor 6
LLARAVEVIPLSVELWLALARLETPERAKAVLNKARKAVPTSHEIWIAAGRLLEQEATVHSDKTAEQRNKELELVERTIEAGVKELRRHQVLLTREQWLKEAEKCESEGSPRTCEAIVKATVAMEVEEEDQLETWVGDAESAEAKGMVGTARAILAYALKVYPDKKNLWRKAAELEKAHGNMYVICGLFSHVTANRSFLRSFLGSRLMPS